MLSWLPALSSPSGASTAGLAHDDRWILDDWPVFECSLPPDDVVLFVLPESSSDQYFSLGGGNFWTMYLINASWLVDLVSNVSPPMATSSADMEADLWLTLGESTVVHPTHFQGEQSRTRELLFGDYPAFDQSVSMHVDGVRATFDTFSNPDWFAPASLCLSLIRDDRLMGAAWFETEGTIFEERFPMPLYLVFHAWRGGEVSWTGEVVDHPYSEPETWFRTPSYLFTTYTGTTADEVWSLPTSEDTGG